MDNDILIFLGTLPWVLFLIIVLMFSSAKGNQSRRLRALFVFVFIFAAIRYGIGYDYFSYKFIIDGNGQDYLLERWEILPRNLAVISGKIHYQLFFAISSFLTIYPVYYVSKKLSIDPLKSFFVYLMFPLFFLDGLGVMRNAVAYSLVFLMFYQLYERKYFYSVALWLLAIGFHTSAVVAVLVYPLFYFFHNRSLNVVLYIVSFILSASIIPLIDSIFPNNVLLIKFLDNVDKDITSVGGIFSYIINGIAIFHLICWKKLSAIFPQNKIYLTLINMGVCLWNIFLSLDPTTAQRLSLYFLLFLVLLIPSYKLIYISNRKVIGFATNTFLILLFISSLSLNLYGYYEKGRSMSNIPYQVFFLEPSDALMHIN